MKIEYLRHFIYINIGVINITVISCPVAEISTILLPESFHIVLYAPCQWCEWAGLDNSVFDPH